MIHFAVYDPTTGEIMARNTVAREEYIPYSVPEGMSLKLGEAPENTYVNLQTGEFEPRFVLLDPDVTYDMANVPDGSVVFVRNEAGDVVEVTGQTEVIQLVDPGTYWFTIEPPFPWIPIKNFEVVVEDTP